MKSIRVGLIGSGFIGGRHVDAIRRIPGTEIVALADANEAAGRKFCEDAGIPHFYTDYRELLKNEHLDVIHNCTPNALHFPVCRGVIEHGINIYCEKPLALTSTETAELCRLAKEKGVKAGVNFNYRQNAAVRLMRQCVQGEANPIGCSWERAFLVRGCYLQDWMQYDTDYNWRCIPELNGPSRTVADIGSHWFDTVQFILGQKIIRVFADLQTVLPYRKKAMTERKTFEASRTDETYESIEIHSEDAAFVLVEFEDGTKGQVTLSQVTSGHKNDLQVCIDGSSYALEWKQENPDKLVIRQRERGSTIEQLGSGMLQGTDARYAPLPSGHPVGWADALYNAIREFYADIRGDNGEYATFEQADYTVRIVEACLKSSARGAWVAVESGNI